MNPQFPPPGGNVIEAWEIRCGDYIRVKLDGGATITAHVTGIDRGPGLPPGNEDVLWEGVFPGIGHPDLPHGHREFGPHDAVTRVWENGLTAA